MAALRDQPINTSFLSPIGFKFQLNNFPEVNYFVQSASLPGISISAIDVPTALKTIAIAGDEVNFEELSIKFIVDENMKNWLAIYDWIIGLGFPTEEGQKKYGSRAWSSMIVKRLEDACNINLRAEGFPSELTDNESEEKGYVI